MQGSQWSTSVKLTVAIFVVVLFFLLLYAARAVLAPIVIGIIIGYIFYPYARFIQYSTAIPHRPATALLYLILLAIIIPLVILAVPFVSEQITFVRDEVLDLLMSIENAGPEATFEFLGFRFLTQAFFDEVVNALTQVVRSFATDAVGFILNVAQLAVLTVITLLIGFWMTSDGDRFIKSIEGAIPDPWQNDIEILVTQVDNIWATFFRSYLVVAIIIGLIMTAVSALIGLPRPVLMGVLAGLLEFIPSIGHLVWMMIAVSVAGIEGSTVALFAGSNLVFMIVALLVGIAYSQLDSRVLIPAIAGGAERLHPVVVVLGIIIGGALAGVLGVVLAAPTISRLKVIMAYIRDRMADDPALPQLEAEHNDANE